VDQNELDRRLAALAALGDRLRRELYHCVVSCNEAVGRDEAAASVGISRTLAAYHLDQLVGAGLLDARYERRPGRHGPGAGRTAKLYERSTTTVEVALPARRYELLAELFARVLDSGSSGRVVFEVDQAARAMGAELAGETPGRKRPVSRADVGVLLTDLGYEPYDDEGVIRLRNCPFGKLAQAHRDLVCRANLAFIEGLVAGKRVDVVRPALDPRPSRCCVTLT
jgi:predicted ArsR family transcriptional regulator